MNSVTIKVIVTFMSVGQASIGVVTLAEAAELCKPRPLHDSTLIVCADTQQNSSDMSVEMEISLL